MKKSAGILVLTLSLLAVSCPQAPVSPGSGGSLVEYPPDLEERTFFAYDNGEPFGKNSDNNYYTVDAVKLGAGEHCEVWVDKSKKVAQEAAERIVAKFDTVIQPAITGVFGSYNAIFAEQTGKIILLLLDIKDNYGKNGNLGYVVGYFDSRDIMASLNPKDYRHGNKAAMLYIDINPSMLDSEQTFATIAHELQHLISFVNTYQYRKTGNTLRSQDIWIDEGLATAAEYIYLKGHDTSRVDHFNKDPNGTIAKGNNFFVWGEERPEGADTVLDDYATVYLFFQWLRIQAGGDTGIYTEIARSDKTDSRAVTEAAVTYFGGEDAEKFGDWTTLLGTWHQANYRNEPAGPYGYGEEGAGIKPRVWAQGAGNYFLYPGEAICSIYAGDAEPDDKNGIQYKVMTRNPTEDNNQYPATDTRRLLMFNTSTTDPKSDFLPGAGTGESNPHKTSRNLWEGAEPYRVDVRDLWGRQGREGPFIIGDLNAGEGG